MPPTLPAHLDLWQKSLGWQPSNTQQARFQDLYNYVLSGNQQLNLTRITEPEDFWEKHLWDSVSPLVGWLADTAAEAATAEGEVAEGEVAEDEATGDEANQTNRPIRIVDIGTGGGFPGVPAAIAFSPAAVDLTLVDSTRKKIIFLQTLCHQLQISASCIAERAEAIGQNELHRESYDLALIRAVGSAATCAEYALPLVSVGGQAVLYRGQWGPQETDALLPVLDLLGGELTDLQSWQTPLSKSDRTCLFIHKTHPTPDDLPRAVGVPGKSPLT